MPEALEGRGGGAKFQPGDSVRVRVDYPPRHIRTPGYIQGKAGSVHAVRGPFKNPESLAYGGDGLPAVYLYQVQFPQAEVWEGYKGGPKDNVLVDIFEHWLEPT